MGFGYESEILGATGFGALVKTSFNLFVENAVEKTQGVIKTKLIGKGYVPLQWVKVQNAGLAQGGHPIVNGYTAVNQQHIRTPMSVPMSRGYHFVEASMKENKWNSVGTGYNIRVHHTTGNAAYTFYGIAVGKWVICVIHASQLRLRAGYHRIVLRLR